MAITQNFGLVSFIARIFFITIIFKIYVIFDVDSKYTNSFWRLHVVFEL